MTETLAASLDRAFAEIAGLDKPHGKIEIIVEYGQPTCVRIVRVVKSEVVIRGLENKPKR